MCVSDWIEQFSAGYFRSGSVLQTILCDGLKKPHPKGRTERPTVDQGSDEPRESVQMYALPERGLSGLDGEVVDSGLHDRLLSLLEARATSALDYLEQKLIYISQIDIRVKTCYTITDEKNSGDYLISRNVRWRVRQFDDVEGAKRRPC